MRNTIQPSAMPFRHKGKWGLRNPTPVPRGRPARPAAPRNRGVQESGPTGRGAAGAVEEFQKTFMREVEEADSLPERSHYADHSATDDGDDVDDAVVDDDDPG